MGPAASRWRRLRPADATDVLALLGMVVGLMLAAVATWTDGGTTIALGGTGVEFVLRALAALHASTPLLAFLALAGYLMRRGRVLGEHRKWVVAGLVVDLPLWFLVGLDVSVRGAGSITWVLVPWNLVALGLMAVGVVRTLGAAASR